jgi:outer membrane receptor for ferrienterochelin and colicins
MLCPRFNQIVAHVAAAAAPVSFAMISPVAYATQGEGTVADSTQQVEITSTYDATADQKNSTVARQVVTQEDLARYGDSGLANALARVPGVVVISRQGKSEVRLRGLGSGYTQILVNGDPAPPGFSIDSLSPAMVERIEVLRTGTVDQSTQAIAGTINIILRQPARKTSQTIKASLAGPDGQEGASLDAQLSGASDSLTYSLSSAISKLEGRTPTTLDQHSTTAGGVDLQRRHTDQQNSSRTDKFELSSALKWTLSPQTAVTVEPWVSMRWIKEWTDDERTALLGPAPAFATDTQVSKADIQMARLNLSLQHDFASGSRLDLKLGGTGGHVLGTSHFLAWDDAGMQVMDEDISATTRRSVLTTKGKFSAPAAAEHSIDLGWDGSLWSLSEDRRQSQTAPPGFPAEDLTEVNDVRIERLAIYAQDEWSISKQLSTYAGIRWETLHTVAEGSAIQRVDSQSAVLSPIVQLVWRLPSSKDDQLRFGLSRTYKAPTVEQLNPRRHVANDNTPTTPDTQGNPALKPELAWGADLSFEHYLPGSAGMFSASAFGRSVRDVIVQDVNLVDGVWTSRPVNGYHALTAGLELEAKLNLEKIVPQWPRVDIRGNLALNWSKVSGFPDGDNRLGGQIPWSVGTGADYQFSKIPLTLGSSVAFTPRRTSRISTSQSEAFDRTTIWDAYALWEPTQSTKLRVSATNLLGQPTRSTQTNTDASNVFRQVTNEDRVTTVRATLELKI